jgi:hypothetical protein
MVDAAARRERVAASVRLEAAVNQVNELIIRQHDGASRLVNTSFDRQVMALARTWDEVSRSYTALNAVNAEGQQVADNAKYRSDLALYEDARNRADKSTIMNQPTEPVGPSRNDQVLALMGERMREEGLMDAEYKAIEDRLAVDTNAPTIHLLALQERNLQVAEAHFARINELSLDIENIDPESRDQIRADMGAKALNVKIRTRGVKTMIAVLKGTLSVRGEFPAEGGSPGNTADRGRQYFTKQPFPKFNGERRNYPGFKREWAETVVGNFPVQFEVREIRKNVPEEIEPDIKNLKNMTDIWLVLDQEYGEVMQCSSELVDCLIYFSYSATAKTNGQKFTELFRAWQTVVEDLKEIGSEDALNHEPTLARISGRFPSDAIRQNYVKLRIKLKNQGRSELQIMKQFMQEEREISKAMERLGTQGRAMFNIDRRCHNCDKTGHLRSLCPDLIEGNRGSKANAVIQQKNRKCPACQDQHVMMGKDGKPFYRTRLSSCTLFNGYTVTEKAELVHSVNGCALCLDWTGSHKKDNCTAMSNGEAFKNCTIMDGGVPCDLKHNPSLHGSDVRYCNTICARPTINEVNKNTGVEALLAMQWVATMCTKDNTLVFWDSGSNICLIRKGYAEACGLKGRPMVQTIATPG